jgi:PAS domain S-box-containing protein
MKTNKISACLRSLKERLYPPVPKHPLMADASFMDSTLKETWVRARGLDSDLKKEIEDTKKTASSILEGLVKRSEIERRRLELIFDSLDDAILMTDRDCLITAANKTARKLFGIQTKEFLGKRVGHFIPEAYPVGDVLKEYTAYTMYLTENGYSSDPETLSPYEDLKNLYGSYIRTTDTVVGVPKDFMYLRPDGKSIPVRIVLNLLTLDPFAEDFGYLVVIHDMTESRTAEAEVMRLKSFTSNLISVAQMPIFNKDAQLKFTFVNAQFRELVSLSEEAIIGKSVDAVFDDDSAQVLTELDLRALASTDTQQASLTMRTKSGDSHDARVFSKAIRNEGLTTGIAGSILLGGGLDAKMRNSVFDAAAKAIVFFDSHLFVTGCNDEFLRLTGIPKAEVIGMHGHREQLVKFIGTDTLNQVSDSIDIDGKLMGRMCTPISNSDGSYEGLVCVFFIHHSQG